MRRAETRLPRRVGTRFEGVFLHGGSFNAITRATPGASPSCLCPPSLPFVTLSIPSSLLTSVLPSGPLILRRRCRRRRRHPRNRHPSLPRPRTYFSSYFIFICFPPPRSLAPTPPLPLFAAPSPPRHTLPSPRTSFRIIFILSSAILVNAIPPVVREPFFILRLNILSRYRAVETSRLEDGEAGRKGDDTPEPDGVALYFRAIKILLASPSNRRGMSSSELRRDSLARYCCCKQILFILL